MKHLQVVFTHHQGNVFFFQAEAIGNKPEQVNAENRRLAPEKFTLAIIDNQARLVENTDDFFQPLHAQVEIHHLLSKRVAERRHHQHQLRLRQQCSHHLGVPCMWRIERPAIYRQFCFVHAALLSHIVRMTYYVVKYIIEKTAASPGR
ncbi:hypothetical protein D3C76_865080 [compost metagenome]